MTYSDIKINLWFVSPLLLVACVDRKRYLVKLNILACVSNSLATNKVRYNERVNQNYLLELWSDSILVAVNQGAEPPRPQGRPQQDQTCTVQGVSTSWWTCDIGTKHPDWHINSGPLVDHFPSKHTNSRLRSRSLSPYIVCKDWSLHFKTNIIPRPYYCFQDVYLILCSSKQPHVIHTA